MKLKINKQIIVILILIVMPLVSADPTVINQNGQQSATINIQPYQIGGNNYADIFIQGINNYLGNEIFIKRLSYPIQILTGSVGLGRHSETSPEPFICMGGDLVCEVEKQNRQQITTYQDTDLFAFPSNLQFDYATLKLKKYNNISSIVSCSNFTVNNFICNSNFEEQNINFYADNLFVYLNLTHFSGWSGTSYFYADMERPGVNLCLEDGDGYRGRCSGSNTVITNYTNNTFMNNEAMEVSTYIHSNEAFAFTSLSEGPQTAKHYSRIYLYISRSSISGLTEDSPIFSVLDNSGNTTSCGFMLDQNSKEEISCIYDTTFAYYNPVTFGTKVNMTQWGLWDKWFTLEYYINGNKTGGGNCTCWINGTQIASNGTLYYNAGAIKYPSVGYPVKRDNGEIVLLFDEHRISDKYIGGYPDIISSYVRYNPVNPSYTQTIYANITDNEGANDINKVYLRFNNTFNISMYKLDNSNTWEVNISSGNFTEGGNYSYTVYANDTNGQNAVPYTNKFLAGICYYNVYLLQPTVNLDINITSNFTMRSCYNTTGTCVYPNWLYHQYYNGIWDLIPNIGNELTSLLNSFYLNTCPKESNANITCTGTGEYKIRSNIYSNYSSSVNVTCGTPEYRALQAIEIAINNTIPNSTRYIKQQVYTVNINNQQSLGRFDTMAILNNQTWSINYVNTTENFTNIKSLPYHTVNVFELDKVTYYEVVSRVQNFISSTL